MPSPKPQKSHVYRPTKGKRYIIVEVENAHGEAMRARDGWVPAIRGEMLSTALVAATAQLNPAVFNCDRVVRVTLGAFMRGAPERDQ